MRVLFVLLVLLGSAALAEKPPTRRARPPKASAIPVGNGWQCEKSYASDGSESSLCFRGADACNTAKDGMKKETYRVDDCRPLDYAACFTYRQRLQDLYIAICSSSFADCDVLGAIARTKTRDMDDVSDCARTK